MAGPQPSSRSSSAIERTTWCATPSRAALGREEDGGHADAARAADVGIDAVAHHDGVLLGQPHPPERELEERGLRLADHERPDSRRRRHRLDDRAAPGQEVAVLERQARVDIRRHEMGARGRGAGGGGEALVAEVEVVADHHHLRLLPLLDGDQRVTAVEHRLLELGPADGEDAGRPPVRGDDLAQDLERREHLVDGGLDPEPHELGLQRQ